jgi:hypothetical protein
LEKIMPILQILLIMVQTTSACHKHRFTHACARDPGFQGITATETGHALSLQTTLQLETIHQFNQNPMFLAKNHANPLNPSNHGSDNFCMAQAPFH